MKLGKTIGEEMKYYDSFAYTGYSFEERIGEPNEFDAAIGKAAMNFWGLDRAVDRLIRYLDALESSVSTIDIESMKFREKVKLLASMVKRHRDIYPFNTGTAPFDEVNAELWRNCLQAGALYSEVRHSDWRSLSEGRGADGVLDVADFICCVEMDLEPLSFVFEESTPEVA